MASSGRQFIEYVKLNDAVLFLKPEEINAARTKHYTELNQLYSQKCKLKETDAEGKTALMHAAILGNFLFIEWALTKNRPFDLTNHPEVAALSKDAISALGYAVQYPDFDEEKEIKQTETEIEGAVSSLPEYIIERRRQIIIDLIKAKANYEKFDTVLRKNKDEPKREHHVMGLASASGNLWFLKTYRRVDSLCFQKLESTVSYFLPQALLSKHDVIVKFWVEKAVKFENFWPELISSAKSLFLQAIATGQKAIFNLVYSYLNIHFNNIISLTDPDVITAIFASGNKLLLEDALNKMPATKAADIYATYLLEAVKANKDISQVLVLIDKLQPIFKATEFDENYEYDLSGYYYIAKSSTKIVNSFTISDIDRAFIIAVHNQQFDHATKILKLNPQYLLDKERPDLHLPASFIVGKKLPKITNNLKEFGIFLRTWRQLKKPITNYDTEFFVRRISAQLTTPYFSALLELASDTQDEDVLEKIKNALMKIANERNSAEEKITEQTNLSPATNIVALPTPSAPTPDQAVSSQLEQPQAPGGLGPISIPQPSAPLANTNNEQKQIEKPLLIVTTPNRYGLFDSQTKSSTPTAIDAARKEMEHNFYLLELAQKNLQSLADKNPELRAEIENRLQQVNSIQQNAPLQKTNSM